MRSITKQNNFSRTLNNEAKMGAYYTDINHCKRIGRLFSFEPTAEYSVLDPSIGDSVAMMTILNKKSPEDNRKVFGVELNPKTYDVTSKNPLVDYCLNADFLSGVKISHKSFGFVFANPPYGTDEQGVRLEIRFLEKISPYMKTGAPIAFVVPYYVVTDEKFMKSFLTNFNSPLVFKFDDDVYRQFKQCCIIGVKKAAKGYLRHTLDAFYEQVRDIKEIPYLPQEREIIEHPLSAVPSKEENIEYFTSLEFNRKAAGEHLNQSTLYKKFKDYFEQDFAAIELGRPPVPLKKDSLYLLAVSGGGQGRCGSLENNDFHLQRGVAKVITTSEYIDTDVEGKSILKERSQTRVSLNIIESNGDITSLS